MVITLKRKRSKDPKMKERNKQSQTLNRWLLWSSVIISHCRVTGQNRIDISFETKEGHVFVSIINKSVGVRCDLIPIPIPPPPTILVRSTTNTTYDFTSRCPAILIAIAIATVGIPFFSQPNLPKVYRRFSPRKPTVSSRHRRTFPPANRLITIMIWDLNEINKKKKNLPETQTENNNFWLFKI